MGCYIDCIDIRFGSKIDVQVDFDCFEIHAKAHAYYSLFCVCAQRASVTSQWEYDEVRLGVNNMLRGK